MNEMFCVNIVVLYYLTKGLVETWRVICLDILGTFRILILVPLSLWHCFSDDHKGSSIHTYLKVNPHKYKYIYTG
jgi:hypothetical protein